jgi:hypothetical protein
VNWRSAANDLCPTCGPTAVEQHPRRPAVTRCANCKQWLRSTENDARSTHVVYRIDSGFRYQETACFCHARAAHSVLDTHPIPPVMKDDQ